MYFVYDVYNKYIYIYNKLKTESSQMGCNKCLSGIVYFNGNNQLIIVLKVSFPDS